MPTNFDLLQYNDQQDLTETLVLLTKSNLGKPRPFHVFDLPIRATSIVNVLKLIVLCNQNQVEK